MTTLDVKQQPQYSVDPRGGISYSGADFQAIVNMPLDTQGFQNEINKLDQEIEKIRSQYIINIDTDALDQIIMQNEIDILEAQKIQMTQDQSKGIEYIKPIVLGNIQTISISWFREKFPVRTFGRVYAKSYCRGSRSIAGSMIFTLFDRQALYELTQGLLKFYNTGVKGSEAAYPDYSTVLVDQLPPFDLTLIASNEYSSSSYMSIYGMELVSGGMTISIQDLMTEDVMQFVARDFDPLRPLIEPHHPLQVGHISVDASDVVKESKNAQERRGFRINPFV